MPDRQRTRRSDAIRNESLVRESAVALFAEFGLELTAARIAEHAGVGRATVYRTFPTREALIDEMLKHRVGWLQERLREAVAQPDPWAALIAFVHRLLQRMRVDKGLDHLLTPTSGMDDQMSVALLPLFEQLLDGAKVTGRVRMDATAVDVGHLASGLATALVRRGTDDPADWSRAADLTLAALGTYPA